MTSSTVSAADETDVSGKRRDFLPGDAAMWIFVLGDFLIFSAYFIIYVVKRVQDPQAFLASQSHLSLDIGVFNTVVLLTSSWFAAQAAHAVRLGDDEKSLRLIKACGFSGVLFVVVKVFEWSIKIVDGHTFTSSEFFSFYYFFTGIHLMHLLLGLVFLAVAANKLRNGAPDRIAQVEAGAIYWHMVDLLWVIILALMYMMR